VAPSRPTAAGGDETPELSVVATLYRSEAFLDAFYARAAAAAGAVTPRFEIVLVNDGSPDGSLARAVGLSRRDPRVRVVDLSRNFGHHRAMMTGLAHARGRLVFLIDADLEEDPAVLSRFHAEMGRSGADVVFGVAARRPGSLTRRLGGRAFFTLFRYLSSVPVPRDLATVRLMTRRYVASLLRHRERETMIAGLWALTGYHQVPVPIERQPRKGTSYGFGRRLDVALDAVTSFSDRPLRLVFYLGLAIFLASSAAAAYLVVRRLFFGVLLPGWPSLIVSVWMLGGLTLFAVGLLGIYVGRVFVETKRRPYAVVRCVYERGQPVE
jgi:putative glycosyltransferase